MSRAPCKHPLPDFPGCPWCGLAAKDRRYREMWWPVAPCRHLGAAVGEDVVCPVCPNNTDGERVPLFACAVHGRTAGERVPPGVRSCRVCRLKHDGYEPATVAPEVSRFHTRHLLYYVCPMGQSGVWERNAGQLRRRLPLFNGRRVVAVATGAGLADPAEVEAVFGPEFEFLRLPHVPQLREVAAWPALWERVPADAGHATFFAHAKGVTKPVDPGVTVHDWTDAMYETLLDYWPAVDRVLTGHPVAGSFKKVGRFFRGSRSRWHYSGTFYWARNAEVLAGPARKIDRAWFGTESWPGLHWPAEEGGVLFHQGGREMDLYQLDYWRGVVVPALEAWRRDHAADRREVIA